MNQPDGGNQADFVTDEEAFEREMALNRAAYDAMKEQFRRDYAGQYVALAFGRLVAVSPDFDDAVAAVKRLQPPPQHYAVFEGDGDPMFDVYYNYSVEF